MIVTVTPNPSIDRTLAVPELRRGEVVRVSSATSEAGGKGINVARALDAMGVAAVAIAPASEATRARLEALLQGHPPLRTVPLDGEIRTNLSLVEPDGTVTKVNEPGPALDPATADRLLDDIAAAIAAEDRVDWVVGSGSLPPGLPDDFHARLATRMRPPIRVAIDADRGALRAAIGGRVSLVKPNRVELEELVGHPLATLGDVLDAAAGLVAAGVEQVLVSLGADGALAVDGSSACHVEAPIDDLANTVGAGDALLAGFLAGGASLSALPEAVAWSVAACRATGTRMPAVMPRDRAAVVVHPTVDRDRPLGR
ncbi:MAG: 1-phosphofructokinase [Chloroflexota bacterium]|jgi:1-phosphofructokinase family hexose kinase|nr:1-phosphofructokinase [Chloroflexota bacterium]